MDIVFDILRWVFVVAGILVVADVFLRRQLSTRPLRPSEFDGANHLHQIVYLPDIPSDGDRSSEPVRETWLEFGDVFCANYGTQRFDPKWQAESIAKNITSRLNDHQPSRLTFVLCGTGGVLGLDVWDEIKQLISLPKSAEVDLILVDTIQGSSNMRGGGSIVAPLMQFAPFGPIYNKLLGPVFRRLQVKAGMAPFSLSMARDSSMYAHNYPDLRPEDFRDVTRVYYVRCTQKNRVVKKSEMYKWQDACEAAGVPFLGIDVEMPHCAFAQMPRLSNSVFRKILRGDFLASFK